MRAPVFQFETRDVVKKQGARANTLKLKGRSERYRKSSWFGRMKSLKNAKDFCTLIDMKNFIILDSETKLILMEIRKMLFWKMSSETFGAHFSSLDFTLVGHKNKLIFKQVRVFDR